MECGSSSSELRRHDRNRECFRFSDFVVSCGFGCCHTVSIQCELHSVMVQQLETREEDATSLSVEDILESLINEFGNKGSFWMRFMSSKHIKKIGMNIEFDRFELKQNM